jgi:hypothetical protein
LPILQYCNDGKNEIHINFLSDSIVCYLYFNYISTTDSSRVGRKLKDDHGGEDDMAKQKLWCLGPDLTNTYSAAGKGPLYISAFVAAGTPVMPSFQLQEHEMSALLEYMRHVDESGKSDPKQFKINYYGTIEGQ